MLAFIETYGYLAILVGTLFEGETILLLGGFAAHHGHLRLPMVMVVAFAGSLLGDQTMFWIGHRYGKQLLAKWPRLERRIDRVRPFLDRFGSALALLFRFLYGLRNITPVAMAMAGFSFRRFALLNAIGAAVWAVGVAMMGYLLGQAVTMMLPRAHHYEAAALIAIICGACAFWFVRRTWARRAPRQSS